MPMQRLLYTSRANLPVEGGDPLQQIQVIAATSSARNRAAGLTGSLLYIDDSFVQVLEGKLEDLETVFERICCDFRHSDVRLIDLVAIRERLFGNWGMAFLSANKRTSLPLRRDMEEIHFMVGANAREAVRQMHALLLRDQHELVA